MNKKNLKKIIEVVGAVIGIIGFVLCVISIFIPEDSIKTAFIKAACVLIMFDIIVLGVLMRIVQVKDAAKIAKKLFGNKEESNSFSKEDSDDYIDPETGALKKTADPVKEVPQVSSPSHYTTREYPKALAVFILILFIIFLLVMVVAPILFVIKQHIAGAITVGVGLFDIVLLGSISSIAEKKFSQSRRDTEDEKNDVTDSDLSDKKVFVQLVEADVSDAEVILEMQKIAFAELLNKYEDYDTSPANETIDKVISRFEDPNIYHYFIKAESENVGVIRVVDSKTEEKKRLSQVFILPQYRRKGYAYSAIKAVEDIYGATGWELDTILQERHLLKLYQSLGYSFKIKTQTINSRMTLAFLEK